MVVALAAEVSMVVVVVSEAEAGTSVVVALVRHT